MTAFGGKDGGEAFPRQALPGMSMRDYFAAKAPITAEVVMDVYGGEVDISDKESRAGFFAVWAFLCYNWADAMLEERKGSKDDSLRSTERRD